MNALPIPSITMAFGLLVDGKLARLCFRQHKATKAARELGAVVVPMIGAHNVRRLIAAIDRASGLGFVSGAEMDELLATRNEIERDLGATPTDHFEQLALAHDTQATAHRLYLLACRNSGRDDDETAAAIAHNATKADYFARLASEARAMGAMSTVNA